MTAPATSFSRDSTLDSLRAFLMFGGIVLHAACAYSTIGGIWWYQDRNTTISMDIVVIFIHIFRMPAFFAISGYFAAILVESRGWKRMLENRCERLGLPFVAGFCVLTVLLHPLGAYIHFLNRDADPIRAAASWVFSIRFLTYDDPMHLWFLEYLLLILAIAAAVGRLLAAWPALEAQIDKTFVWVMESRWAPLLLAIPSAAILSRMEFGVLATPGSFRPDGMIVLAYCQFFAFGWLVGRNRHLRDQFSLSPWRAAAEGLVLSTVHIACVAEQAATRTTIPFLQLGAAISGGLAVWLAIFALMGLFQRYASEPSAVSRYLADSSYWIYLVHPVALVPLELLLRPISMPGEIKFLCSLVVAIPLLLWSYETMVRATWLGKFLNGRRKDRIVWRTLVAGLRLLPGIQ